VGAATHADIRHAGGYGSVETYLIVAGKRWEEQVYPIVRNKCYQAIDNIHRVSDLSGSRGSCTLGCC
jgi:hypothetical protein